MRKERNSIRVKLGEQTELFLSVLAFMGGTDRGSLLARLVEEEAARQGLTAEAASKILEGRRKSTDSLVNQVREKRQKQNLSQRLWGQLFGLTQSNVASIENGKRQLPRHLQKPVAQWLIDGLVPISPEDGESR